MSRRFVPASTIERRMREKDARVNAEIERRSFGFPKPAKGTAYMESKDRRADRVNAEQAEMQAAMKRDNHKCRWPGCNGTYRGLTLPIDPCHIFEHRGMGGNPKGDRTSRELVAALCREHHRQLDADEIQIQATDADLADGLLAFYRKNLETGVFEHVATETRQGESVTR